MPATVITRPETETRTQAGGGSGHASCDGCPRCQEPATAGYCPLYHAQFGARHPVCKICGHCVLRGQHGDDAEDLKDYEGQFTPAYSISRN